jgi:hypothetical protein
MAPKSTSTAASMSDYRAALIGTALLAAIAGFAFAGAAAPGEPELALLIRFMAVIKAAMALGAVALVAWRLTLPATPRLAFAGIAACALMAAGPGLIWGMQHVIAGAVLFHAGFALLLVLAWRDRGVLTQPASSSAASASSHAASAASVSRRIAASRAFAAVTSPTRPGA